MTVSAAVPMSLSLKRKHVFLTYHHSVEAQSFDNRVLSTFQKYCLSFTKADECQLAPLTVDRKYEKWNLKRFKSHSFKFPVILSEFWLNCVATANTAHATRNTWARMKSDGRGHNVINIPSLPFASYSLTITDDIQLYWISWPWCFCSEIRGGRHNEPF